MPRSLALACCLFIATNAQAGKKNKAPDPAPEPIFMPCDWEEGLAFAYDHQRRRTDAGNAELAKLISSTPTAVTVMKSASPVHFAYKSGTTTFEGPEELVAASQAQIDGFELPAVQLMMTEGTLNGVLNHLELVDAMEPMLRKALGDDQALDQTLAMFRDPALGPQLLLRDVSKFFAMHCVAMAPGQVIEAPVELPNPFGGEPIPGTSRIEVTSWDEEAKTLTIETVDRTDPDALKAMLPAILQRFGMPEGVKIEEAMAGLPPISSLMKGTFTYSAKDGFPLAIEVRQDIGDAGHAQHRSDTWTWKRIE
jgi:hypothetical protein